MAENKYNVDGTNTVSSELDIPQVKKENKFNFKKTAIHIVLGGILLLVMLVITFSNKHEKKLLPDQPVETQRDYNAELQTNLAKLKAANAEIKTELTNIKEVPLSNSKEYMARQHAPSKMYEEAAQEKGLVTSESNSSSLFAGNGVYDRFGNQTTQTDTLTATKISHPEYTIVSGEFIHAFLETKANSDLPGMIRAIVSKPVYSYQGERMLIPAGSRLMGQYASTVFQGVNSIFVVWNRIVLPNGISIQINSPGTSELGEAGMVADTVNTHFFARFGNAALLSILGAGVATYGVNPQDQYNSLAMYRSAISQSFEQSAQQSLQENSSIKNTLIKYQGAEVNVFVAHDLSFYNVLTHQMR